MNALLGLGGRLVGQLERQLDRPAVRGGALGLLVLAGLLGGLLTGEGRLPDFQLFAAAGDELLAGRWAEVFADPVLQAGPVILVLSAVLGHLGGPTTIAVAGPPVVALLAVRATRSLRAALDLDARPALELAAGAAILLWELGQGGVHSGHLSQLIIPVLWLGAGVAAHRGQVIAAGVLLGLSAGCETWGVLGAPVLLLSGLPAERERRQLLRGALALLAVAGLLYLPFALTGSFRMLQFRWWVGGETIYGQLAPGLVATGFPWWARCLQAVAAIVAGTAVARARRTDRTAIWMVPLAAVLVRLLLDPVAMNYYWTAAVVLLIAGAVVSPPRTAAFAAVACWWQFFPAARIWYGTALVSVPLLVAVLIAGAVRHPVECERQDDRARD